MHGGQFFDWLLAFTGELNMSPASIGVAGFARNEFPFH